MSGNPLLEAALEWAELCRVVPCRGKNPGVYLGDGWTAPGEPPTPGQIRRLVGNVAAGERRPRPWSPGCCPSTLTTRTSSRACRPTPNRLRRRRAASRTASRGCCASG